MGKKNVRCLSFKVVALANLCIFDNKKYKDIFVQNAPNFSRAISVECMRTNHIAQFFYDIIERLPVSWF